MSELQDTIEYFEERRDKALNYFIDKVKNYRLYNDEDLHKSLNTVLRICRQLKTMEDAALVYNIYKT
jgi:hypothetical protein